MLSEFGANKEVALAYLNAARGLGFLGGPMSGQLFYTYLGYLWTFVTFAGILVFAMLFTMFKLPNSLNGDTQKSGAVRRATVRLSQMQKSVTYGQILSIKRALFCLITVVFALFFSVEPFLSKALQDIGFDKNLVGYIFGFFAFMYTLMAFMVGPLTKRFTSRVVSFFSYIIIATGCALFGPSSIIRSVDYTCTSAKCGL